MIELAKEKSKKQTISNKLLYDKYKDKRESLKKILFMPGGARAS